MNYSYANIIRDKTRVFVSFPGEDPSKQQFKVIEDKNHDFVHFSDQKISFLNNFLSRNLQNFLESSKKKYNIGFWDLPSFFFDFKSQTF